ncbi:Trimethylamine-N-oxide reductase 1 precursor [compost metagenome]
MHPQDAIKRGIVDGVEVLVSNARGSCLAGVAITDGVTPGVVLMATGAWFDASDSLLERHGNPNVLTMDRGTSSLAQASSALSALVEIAPWSEGEPPEVQAFELPVLCPLAK